MVLLSLIVLRVGPLISLLAGKLFRWTPLPAADALLTILVERMGLAIVVFIFLNLLFRLVKLALENFDC